MQMKFYSPLTADFFPNDTEDLGDDYSEYEGIPYTGKELTGYRDVIRDAIYEDVKDFYGDLMRYYREDDSVRRKVVRAVPTVDEVNGELVGSLWVDTDAPLTAEEQAVFCAYISGQYRYLYELGALPRKPRRPSYAVRQDAYKLDQRIRQMEFLSRNNIDTLAQLETHRQALQTEIGQLLTKRKQLPKTDDVQSQCESVNTALKQLRQEERLCRKIAEHSLEVQQHLTEARRDRAAQQQREQERARDRRSNIDLTL